MLVGFVRVVEKKIVEKPSITVRGSAFIGNRTLVDVIKGERCELLYNDKTHQIAVRSTEAGGVRKGRNSVHLSSVPLRSVVNAYFGDSEYYLHSYRIDGKYHPEEDAVIFNLDDAKEINL